MLLRSCWRTCTLVPATTSAYCARGQHRTRARAPAASPSPRAAPTRRRPPRRSRTSSSPHSRTWWTFRWRTITTRRNSVRSRVRVRVHVLLYESTQQRRDAHSLVVLWLPHMHMWFSSDRFPIVLFKYKYVLNCAQAPSWSRTSWSSSPRRQTSTTTLRRAMLHTTTTILLMLQIFFVYVCFTLCAQGLLAEFERQHPTRTPVLHSVFVYA